MIRFKVSSLVAAALLCVGYAQAQDQRPEEALAEQMHKDSLAHKVPEPTTREEEIKALAKLNTYAKSMHRECKGAQRFVEKNVKEPNLAVLCAMALERVTTRTFGTWEQTYDTRLMAAGATLRDQAQSGEIETKMFDEGMGILRDLANETAERYNAIKE